MSAASACFAPQLQPAAYQLAVLLAAQGTSKAGQLADSLGMDKSAISRLGRSLCEAGLASARSDPDDKRSTLYSLTEEGRARMKASDALKARAFFSRFEGWDGAELHRFHTLLHKFNHAKEIPQPHQTHMK